MLLRDLQANVVWEDIAAWINVGGYGNLPSGADERAKDQLLMPLLNWEAENAK
jgi:hypothetical protein